MSIFALGDSIAAGYGVPVSFIGRIANARGDTLTNLGLSGVEPQDLSNSLFTISRATLASYFYMAGVNSQRRWGVNPANLQNFRDCIASHLLFLALNPADMISGLSFATTGAGWAATPVHGSLGVNTNTLNSQATATLAGDVLYVSTITQDSAPGQYEIWVDGILRGTYSTTPYSTIASALGTSYAARLIRLPGCGAGSHTVAIKSIAATGTANKTYIDWATGSAMRTSWHADVTICTPTPFSAAGYIAAGGSLDATKAYGAAVKDVAAILSADGYPIRACDTFGVIDVGADLQVDNCHPNDNACNKMACAAL